MTIYSHFGSKEGLFIQVLEQVIAERSTDTPSLDGDVDEAELVDTLMAIAVDLVETVQDPEVVGLRRVLVAEQPRRPGSYLGLASFDRGRRGGSADGILRSPSRAKPALRRRTPGARHAVPVDAHRRPARCRAARPTRYAPDVACPRVTCGPNRVGCLRQSPALSGFRSDPCSKGARSLDAECCPYSHSMSAHTCRINTSPHG